MELWGKVLDFFELPFYTRHPMKDDLIHIKNLQKTYMHRGKPLKKALKGVSFSIKKGETLGLLGVNGAGKTTLSSILSGMCPPTAGEVLWHDQSIYSDITKYRRQVGFCPQKPNLDNMLTLGESLIFSGRAYGLTKSEAKERAEQVMADFSIGSYAESLAAHLSGGYKQRFLMARTLMHSPEFIILDEPTVGLDPHIRHQLWEVLKRLKSEGTTILLTTHYLDEAQTLSDRVCFIHGGEVKIVDTPDNLLKKYKKTSLEDVFIDFVDETEIEIFSRKDDASKT